MGRPAPMEPDATRGDAVGPPAPRFIELDLRKDLPWTRKAILGIVAIAALAVFGFATLLGNLGAIVLLVVVSVVVGAVGVPVLYWAPRRAAAIVRSSPDVDAEAVMRTVLARVGWLESTSVITAAIQAMVRSGRTGVVVAVRQMGRHTPFRAAPTIGVPFEPLHLQDLAARIDELDGVIPRADTSVLVPASSRPSVTTDERAQRSILRRRRWKRTALRVLSGVGWMPLATGAFFVVYGWKTARADPDPWVFLILLGGLLAYVSMKFVGRGREVLGVPGGLVFRSATPASRSWKVRLCTPRESNLCLINQQGRQWLLIAADGQHSYRRVLVESDAVAAYQAWISPLPPPSPEQLSDLE
ncbi:MAG: hypothetical protein JXB13_03665 [Phycisphaerae bacterium]|nr:hypothetical protein [Phycisphaerae bacterium]